MTVQSTPLSRALDVVGQMEFEVRGRSMRPFAPEGSRLVCRSPRPNEDLLHRIVVAHHGGRQLAHRVVRRWTDREGVEWVRMRGDNSAGCEDVRRDEVLAVADVVTLGSFSLPVHRLPPRVEGASAWLGRQVVVLPLRTRRLLRRAAARVRAAG